MIGALRKFAKKLFGGLFKSRKELKLGLYGPPNGGKTTLAKKLELERPALRLCPDEWITTRTGVKERRI